MARQKLDTWQPRGSEHRPEAAKGWQSEAKESQRKPLGRKRRAKRTKREPKGGRGDLGSWPVLAPGGMRRASGEIIEGYENIQKRLGDEDKAKEI